MLLIDTDIASYAIKSQHKIAGKLLDLNPDSWAISTITYHEISFGLNLDGVHSVIKESAAKFLETSKVLDFDAAAATAAAEVRKKLRLQGKPTGYFDSLIAGHALSIDATLVSNNPKHFQAIKNLKLENWL
jgi:tRNA(fMet)-specific endonuclease VapC